MPFYHGLCGLNIEDGSKNGRVKSGRTGRGANDDGGDHSCGDRFRCTNSAQVLPNAGVVANGKLRPLIRSWRGRCGSGCRPISSTGNSSDGIAPVAFRPLVSGGRGGAKNRVRRRKERTSNGEVRCGLTPRARGTPIRVRRFILVTGWPRLPRRHGSLYCGHDGNDSTGPPVGSRSGCQVRCNVGSCYDGDNVRHFLEVPHEAGRHIRTRVGVNGSITRRGRLRVVANVPSDGLAPSRRMGSKVRGRWDGGDGYWASCSVRRRRVTGGPLNDIVVFLPRFREGRHNDPCPCRQAGDNHGVRRQGDRHGAKGDRASRSVPSRSAICRIVGEEYDRYGGDQSNVLRRGFSGLFDARHYKYLLSYYRAYFLCSEYGDDIFRENMRARIRFLGLHGENCIYFDLAQTVHPFGAYRGGTRGAVFVARVSLVSWRRPGAG